MSKPITNTRGKIRDKALEMFNERGIEYVGLRELAALLDIRVSNITYYFPTKDDLVFELSQELGKANAALIREQDNLTLAGFLEMLQQVFHNHVRFRCLLLSVVHLITQNKHMATAYRKTQHVRNHTIKSNLEVLRDAGYLNLEEASDLDFLVSGISLVSRFWISEAAVTARNLSTEEQLQYYLNLITKLLWPYATAKGKKEVKLFLEGLKKT